jgi:hypothetical protein
MATGYWYKNRRRPVGACLQVLGLTRQLPGPQLSRARVRHGRGTTELTRVETHAVPRPWQAAPLASRKVHLGLIVSGRGGSRQAYLTNRRGMSRTALRRIHKVMHFIPFWTGRQAVCGRAASTISLGSHRSPRPMRAAAPTAWLWLRGPNDMSPSRRRVGDSLGRWMRYARGDLK